MSNPQIPKEIESILFTSDQLRKRVIELADQISKDYQQILKEDEDLIILSILKGAYMFTADLSRHLTIPNRVEFLAVSSYGEETTSTGEVKIIMDTRHPISGKHVLIIEDIIDSGATLSFLIRLLKSRNPASLKAAALLKSSRKKFEKVSIDYIGFDSGDKFVVGYGLDWAEKFRNLPYIGIVSTSAVEEYNKKRKK